MLVAAAVLLTGLVADGVRPMAPPRVTRSAASSMMAKPTPKVPYKFPGMEEPTWVNIYNRMYRERIMFMSRPIGDDFANQMIAVLLYLESEDATSPAAISAISPAAISPAAIAEA